MSVNPAPFVRLSPQDQSVALGTTAMLGVQLLGQPPFTYQWLFNRAALPGQTGATLSLAGVQPAQAGRYSVAVTNAFGGVVSPEAELTIIRPAFTFGRATNGSGGLALSFAGGDGICARIFSDAGCGRGLDGGNQLRHVAQRTDYPTH